MHKKKSKKRFKKIIILVLLYIIISKLFINISLKSSNEEFIKGMLDNNNYYLKYKENYLNLFVKYLFNIDLSEPKNILENTLSYKTVSLEQRETKYVHSEIKPKIYIYNTHQTEGYQGENLSDYNINPDVLMASYLLQGLLLKDNISVLVEERRMSDYLKENNLDYSESYKASRTYLLDTLTKSDFDLIIDLHRDAIRKDLSTVNIDNKNYAKFLFVIGSNHANYEKNYNLAYILNEKIKAKYPNLTRGILIKPKSIFNQDVNDKIILIECGGNENTIDEVMNSILVLKEVIKEYIGEIYEEKK